MMRFRYQLALAGGLLVFGLAAGCGGDPSEASHAQGGSGGPDAPEAEEETVPVEASEVTVEPMAALYSTSATLRAERTATVTTRTQGVVESLLVEEGDIVTAGQVLARLEDEEQRIARDRAVANLENKEDEYRRIESLYEQELVSEEAYQLARRDYLDAKHAADLADLELSRTAIRAPFSGVVLRRHLDVGNTVTATTPVYDLADVTPLQADVNVPERHVSRLEQGQTVRLVSDASGRGVDATIERIAPGVDPDTGTVKVTLAVEADGDLRPGTFVRVDIVTDTHPDALVVPRSALVAEGRRWYVYKVAEDGTADRLEVELGYESRDRVEVTVVSEGDSLAPGEQVVVAGAGALEEGSPLDILEAGHRNDGVVAEASEADDEEAAAAE